MGWGSAIAADMNTYAFVQDDGSLRIQGETVRLYGIYIPPTDQTCQTFIRPVPCGTRASLALEFKIGANFVRCKDLGRFPDGSIQGYCTVNGEDLSAWMLTQGWALARPDAPFEYEALEKIARSRRIGVWGIPVDRIR